MGLWKSFAGLLVVEITSAAPAEVLTAVNNRGITLFDIAYIDELHVSGKIYRNDFHALQNLLNARDEEIKVTKRIGLYWLLRGLLERPILTTGLLVFLIIGLYLPTRVLFVQVEGNRNVSSRLITERAQLCGIGFGASRRDVRSERAKNALLSSIPELQWVGVNTVGCTAVISVQERSNVDNKTAETGVCSVVAVRDGIISEMIVTSGNPMCQVGQAVKEGQVLVSAYTDCGISIKAQRANAEITAYTFRNFDALTLISRQKRGTVVKEKLRYSLRLGKKFINFYKDSGISDATCVKMSSEKSLTLPGGFRLPVALVTERTISYSCENVVAEETDAPGWIEELSDAYMESTMVNGKILQKRISVEENEDVLQLRGKYSCLEMIGRIRDEETIQGNGKTD